MILVDCALRGHAQLVFKINDPVQVIRIIVNCIFLAAERALQPVRQVPHEAGNMCGTRLVGYGAAGSLNKRLRVHTFC